MDFDRAQDKEIVDYVVNNFKRAKNSPGALRSFMARAVPAV